MALNTAVFKTRALSALVFVALMLLGLLWNFWSFFVLFSVIHFGCWYEYQRIITRVYPPYGNIPVFHRYGVMVAGWCIMLFFTGPSYSILGLPLHTIGYWLGLVSLLILPLGAAVFSGRPDLVAIRYSLLGLLYISLSWGLLVFMRSNYFGGFVNIGKWLVLLIIASIWINDTMAYIVGSLIGKTPLTRISPKKTWEGTLGGILLSVATLLVAAYMITEPIDAISILPWGIIAAIAAIAGTFGDLLESKLKRMADIKDSGAILPGHGGFLDRFDSLLLATPFVWIYVVLFLK